MLKQGLQQKLLQKLSPQQIQFIKLLQIPTAMLETRIKQELEENPALMEAGDSINGEEFDLTQYMPSLSNQANAPTTATDQAAPTPEPTNTTNDNREVDGDEDGHGQEVSLEDYIEQEDDYQYKTQLPDDPNQERYEAPIVQMSSMFDSLMQQIHMFQLDEMESLIAQQIIGSVDEDGYFRRDITAIVDDLAFRQNIYVTDEQVENVLYTVQQLDPPGVAARDLQECLLLQLDRQPSTPDVKCAQEILMDYFEEFTKKHFDRIMERLNISREQFRDAYNQITRLNPKPGESETEVKSQYIIPDFILSVENGEIDIKLNRRNAPSLSVNKGYMKMLAKFEKMDRHDSREAKETIQFVKNKIDAAKWFIDAIRQRQYTLLRTMASIADKQREFFISEGDAAKLRPMILKDIAEEIGMDISTISRVANSKYVQTDFGIYQLKYFFSEGITTESGEEVSNKEVKKILKDMIEGEKKGKPLSDDKLALMLNQKGYNIARRTVAKYREQMNIPVARLRKEV